MRIAESIKDEEILQNVSETIATKIIDLYNQGQFRTLKVRQLVPPRMLGHLLGRLGGVDIIFHRHLQDIGGNASFMFKEVSINASLIENNKRDRIVSVLIHELRHMLDNSMISNNVKNMKLRKKEEWRLPANKSNIRSNILSQKHKGTKKDVKLDADDKSFFKYRSKHIEVGARVSEAFNFLKNELDMLRDEKLSNSELKRTILEALDRFDLIRIFEYNDPSKFDDDREKMNIFGRDTPRSGDLFVPWGNKEFRHIFSRLYTYAIHYINKQKVKESITESVSRNLFHITSFESALSILRNNELLSHTDSISFARTPQNSYHRDHKLAGVIFAVNGDKLNRNYKGAPVGAENFFYNEDDPHDVEFLGKSGQAEDRLYTSSVKNFDKFIDYIIIYSPDYKKNKDEFGNSYENDFKFAKDVVSLAKQKNIPIKYADKNSDLNVINNDKRKLDNNLEDRINQDNTSQYKLEKNTMLFFHFLCNGFELDKTGECNYEGKIYDIDVPVISSENLQGAFNQLNEIVRHLTLPSKVSVVVVETVTITKDKAGDEFIKRRGIIREIYL